MLGLAGNPRGQKIVRTRAACYQGKNRAKKEDDLREWKMNLKKVKQAVEVSSSSVMAMNSHGLNLLRFQEV